MKRRAPIPARVRAAGAAAAALVFPVLLPALARAQGTAEFPHEVPDGPVAGCLHIWGQTEFIAAMVNFGVLVALAIILARKPLTNFLKERRFAVEEGLAEAARLKQEAQARYDQYTARLERLDEELEQLRRDMVKAGEAERDRIIAEAETKAARMRRETRFVIDQQLKQLRADLTREAVDAAIQTAEQVLREKSTSADQQRLAQSYLETLTNIASNGRAAEPEVVKPPAPRRQEEQL